MKKGKWTIVSTCNNEPFFFLTRKKKKLAMQDEVVSFKTGVKSKSVLLCNLWPSCIRNIGKDSHLSPGYQHVDTVLRNLWSIGSYKVRHGLNMDWFYNVLLLLWEMHLWERVLIIAQMHT